MAEYCPIGSGTIDQSIVRGVSFLVLCSISVFLILPLDFILIYLIFDFFMRGFDSRNLSLFVLAAKSLSGVFACRVVPVSASPKGFAARIGFIVCVLILFCRVLNFDVLVYVLSGFLLVAASLESFFSVCLGCHIYSIINREQAPKPQKLDL